jgi:four helix bundle protein
MGELAVEFTDLDVYQEAASLAGRVFVLTKGFPREEAYALTDQLRRASRSIGAQIAEAWGKRRYPKHFFSKLTDADAETREARHWVSVALECEYLGNEEADDLFDRLERIGRMLTRMMKKADDFQLT